MFREHPCFPCRKELVGYNAAEVMFGECGITYVITSIINQGNVVKQGTLDFDLIETLRGGLYKLC